MSEEIKEILENVRKCCEIMKEQSFVVYQRTDILKLLDYIQQKENIIKELQEDIDILTSDEDNDSVWNEDENK